MSRDGERLIELASELTTRVGNALTDMVPPAAQVHLLNAQRELITALVLIYENRVTTGGSPRSRRTRGTGRAATRSAPRRVRKIPIE